MNRFGNICVCLSLLVILLAGGVFLPSDALCRLTAEADIRYVNYDSKDNTQHVSANSLTQQYSILYQKSGKIVSGRLGSYNVGLGYEWLTFDTGIKSGVAPAENLGGNRGHIFYNGEVLIDPKEIPFRLSLYSRDMNKSSFSTVDSSPTTLIPNSQINPFAYSTSSSPTLNGGLSSTSSGNRFISIPPDLTRNIQNGKHIESGATLVMGVKNGMTNGYNEFLRHFPMLMLDYQDQINQEKNSLFPVDNRLTKLAFVSLNKKDNWFHYRYITYNDYIDSSNDYRETQIQLGTVDQNLARRWIDFSNWLNVSADGQLTKRTNAKSDLNREEFSLNFFGTARRQNWEVRTFNNFSRLHEINDRNTITYSTSVPVYANGIISPTANWSAYTKYNESHTDKGAYFTTINSGYNINAFNRSLFTLGQGLGVEQVSASDGSDTLILNGSVSTASTSRYSRDLSLKAAYSIRNYRYSGSTSATNFTDQDIRGDLSYSLSDKLRVTASQTNRFTTGTSQYIVSPIADVYINSVQYVSPRPNVISSGSSSYHSVTTVGVAWQPRPRLNLGLNVTEDIFAQSTGQRSNSTRAEATLDYSDGKLKITSNTGLVIGDAYGTGLTDQVSTKNAIFYTFSRSLDAKAGFSYFRSISGSNQAAILNLEQSLNYNFYQVSGIARKLFEINESFTSVEEYVASTVSATTTTTTKQRINTLLLGAKYYPLRQLIVSGGAKYSFVNGFVNDSVYYYGSLAVRFKLLEASLDYTYGKNMVDNRVEKKFMANVKKRF